MKVDCSLIILAHNGMEFTEKSLNNLVLANDYPTELFLIDNGSSDDTSTLFRSFIPRFKKRGIVVDFWRNEENKGCSEARNDAWEKASCEYVVLLDNDALPRSQHWLSSMKAIMDGNPDIGILGPKMVYPFEPHNIQCAGVTINSLGRIAFRGRGKAIDSDGYNEFREVHLLISACWMMRNSLRDSAGMLDPIFHPVQYEDLDLCFRASKAGYKIVYTPNVEMYHFEGITTASFGAKEYKRNIAKNSLKFRERWHNLYKTFADELPSAEFRWLARTELGLEPKLNLELCD